MSHNNPPARNAVIAAIRKHGPMTCAEVAEVLGWTVARTHGVIANTRRLQPNKVFRVIRYQRSVGKGKDASVYAARPGEDVPRPAIDQQARDKEKCQRYRDKHRATVNARHRQARAEKSGTAAQPNLWLQLAPVAVRALMTLQTRHALQDAASNRGETA